jgi:hypothetical protein
VHDRVIAGPADVAAGRRPDAALVRPGGERRLVR